MTFRSVCSLGESGLEVQGWEQVRFGGYFQRVMAIAAGWLAGLPSLDRAVCAEFFIGSGK